MCTTTTSRHLASHASCIRTVARTALNPVETLVHNRKRAPQFAPIIRFFSSVKDIIYPHTSLEMQPSMNIHTVLFCDRRKAMTKLLTMLLTKHLRKKIWILETIYAF